MKTKSITNRIKGTLAAGLAGLVGLVQTANAQTNKTPSMSLSGDVSYFAAEKAESGAPTSYLEVNHLTKLPYSTKISGFMDFYKDDRGYFGKTTVEKGLTERINLRSQVLHINGPFSQAGIGLSYVVPTPKKLFAKISYLPLWADSHWQYNSHKQIAGLFVSYDLPNGFYFWGSGEVNVAGAKGPQWSYGEIELAKMLGKRISVGANIQLNSNGPGKLGPEVAPRAVVRIKF